MEQLRNLMGKKVYGIPIVALVALFAAGVLWYAIRMPRVSDAESDSTEDIEGDPGEEDIEGDYGNPRNTTTIFEVATDPTPDQPTDTDDAWARRVIAWLTSQGSTATQATNAVQGYLAGESLSYESRSLINRAIEVFGLPPEGIPQSGGTKKYKGPATRAGTPPVTHTVKGTSDDSYPELATLYYGQATADAITLLRAAGDNPKLGNPKTFPPGTSVYIPAWRKPRFFKATSAARTLYAIAKKNGTDTDSILALNPGMNFPVKVGKKVRVR